MKAIPKASKIQSRFSVCLALLLVFSLLAHSFEACAAHTGLPDKLPQTASSLDCKNPVSADSSCVHSCRPADHALDLCEVVSEISTAASHGFELEAPSIVGLTPFAPPREIFALALPCGALCSRDGPDAPSLASLFRRSTLPARSPPLSA